MLCDNLPQRMPNMPTGEHSRTSEKDVRRYLVLVVNFIQWGLKMLKLKQFCKAIVSNSCRAKFIDCCAVHLFHGAVFIRFPLAAIIANV